MFEYNQENAIIMFYRIIILMCVVKIKCWKSLQICFIYGKWSHLQTHCINIWIYLHTKNIQSNLLCRFTNMKGAYDRLGIIWSICKKVETWCSIKMEVWESPYETQSRLMYAIGLKFRLEIINFKWSIVACN
jgi:hypothetical protein